jgi:hypothetical protein
VPASWTRCCPPRQPIQRRAAYSRPTDSAHPVILARALSGECPRPRNRGRGHRLAVPRHMPCRMPCREPSGDVAESDRS